MALRSIDHLRALLDHLDGDERSHQLAFFQAVLEAGPDSIAELDARLPGARAPRALRLLATEASFYFPWPGWVRMHQRLLRNEPDREIFLTGVRALGRLGTEEALEVLRELSIMRQEGEFQEILAEVLNRTHPQEAFSHHLARLLLGSANAAAANEAAQRLSGLVDGGSIAALMTVARHPDLLVFRHALALLAQIQTPEAAGALREIFADSHREALADRRIKEELAAMRGAAPAAAAAAAFTALEALEADPARAADADGFLGTFYREVLAAAQDGRPGPLAAALDQAAEDLRARSRRLGYALDTAAEGLAEMALRGLADRAEVLGLLVQAQRHQSGKEGVARALARVVPADAQEIHQLQSAAREFARRGTGESSP
jgi:hypothetical protein